MPTSRTGHFVQVYLPAKDTEFFEVVEVAGRKLYTTSSRPGWHGVSREMPLRRARKFAKEYARAGFKARVIFRANYASWFNPVVVLELKAHRRK